MAGDSGEFADVYEDHVWYVYGFFGYRLASREECEDLTQQTFERALKAWERFDPSRAQPKTWLLTIANNLLIDHYRRGRSTREQLIDRQEALERVEAAAAPQAGDLGLTGDLERALAELSGRERELIALRFGGDLTGAQIAELTGLSIDNVHQIVSRSLRKLRAHLEAEASAGLTSPD
jgi:RNA polymerase sigma-70 factor (ECF subfamily)